MPGQEGIQHLPLHGGGMHSGTPCHNNSSMYPLDAVADVVLSYRPKSKVKKARKRKKRK